MTVTQARAVANPKVAKEKVENQKEKANPKAKVQLEDPDTENKTMNEAHQPMY